MSADARTVSFLSLLRGTAHRCGLDPDQLATTEAAALAEHLTVAARKAWQHYDWPDCVALEERLLKALYSAGTTYASGTIVYDEDTETWYESQQAGNLGHALTDTDWWDVPDPWERSLALVATGYTSMGEVLNIYDQDPDLDGTSETAPQAQPIGYRLDGANIILDTDAPNSVWVRFRKPSPLFTTTAWSAATAYTSGDLAYLAPHCYLCIAPSTNNTPPNTTYWREQSLPALFENAVKRLAKAEWLGSEEQEEKALAVGRLAQDDLDDATARISDDQGQSRRYAVATRTTISRQFQPRRLRR